MTACTPAITGDIGAILRAARGDRTINEIATAAGIDPSTWWRIEAGKVTPSVATLSAISRVIGVPLDQLIHAVHGNAVSTRRGKNDGDTAAVGSRSDVPYSHEGV